MANTRHENSNSNETPIITIDPTTPIDSEQKRVFYSYLSFNPSREVFHQDVAIPFSGLTFKLNHTLVKTFLSDSKDQYQYTVFNAAACDLNLIKINTHHMIDPQIFQNAEENNTPILIKSNTGFSIYGCVNGEWDLRKINETPDEIVVLHVLPFDKNIIIDKSELKSYDTLLPLLIKYHDGFAANSQFLGSGGRSDLYIAPGALIPDGNTMIYCSYPASAQKALKVTKTKNEIDAKLANHEYKVMLAAPDMNPYPVTNERNNKQEIIYTYLLHNVIEGKEYTDLVTNLRYGKIPFIQGLIYFTKFLEAIVELQKRSIIHRDIKPENTIVNYQTGKVTIIDFDLSLFEHELENANIVGTPAFVAPETIAGQKQSYEIDWYAGGVVFSETFDDKIYLQSECHFDKNSHYQNLASYYFLAGTPKFQFPVYINDQLTTGDCYDKFILSVTLLRHSQPSQRDIYLSIKLLNEIIFILTPTYIPSPLLIDHESTSEEELETDATLNTNQSLLSKTYNYFLPKNSWGRFIIDKTIELTSFLIYAKEIKTDDTQLSTIAAAHHASFMAENQKNKKRDSIKNSSFAIYHQLGAKPKHSIEDSDDNSFEENRSNNNTSIASTFPILPPYSPRQEKGKRHSF